MTEYGYDERTTDYATTNTTKLSTSAGIITDLSFTFEGTGDPVLVEFFAPGMANSSNLMTSWFLVTEGTATTPVGYRNWSASTGGAGGVMRLRMATLDGVSYTLQVGLSATAGTTTARGAVTVGGVTTGAMYLRVTD